LPRCRRSPRRLNGLIGGGFEMIDYADNIVELNGVAMRICDVPDAGLRALWGYGHFPYDLANRQVMQVEGRTWPYTPDTCRADNYGTQGEWITPEVLVCPGCGMDFT
jgi:hypothetical protein